MLCSRLRVTGWLTTRPAWCSWCQTHAAACSLAKEEQSSSSMLRNCNKSLNNCTTIYGSNTAIVVTLFRMCFCVHIWFTAVHLHVFGLSHRLGPHNCSEMWSWFTFSEIITFDLHITVYGSNTPIVVTLFSECIYLHIWLSVVQLHVLGCHID